MGKLVNRVLGCGILLAVAMPASGGEWWNPFSMKSKTPAKRSPLVDGQPLWTSSEVAPRGPSTWDKMAAGTKKAATGVADAVTLKPWRKKPATEQTGYSTWSGTPHTTTKKTTWLGSVFKSKPQKKSMTVSEWMSQDRPGY